MATKKLPNKTKKVWYQLDFLSELDKSLSMPQPSPSPTPTTKRSEHEPSKWQSNESKPTGPNFSESEQDYIKRNENNRRIGESHPRSKYTDHEVELILQLRDLGMTIRKIAKKMDVPFSTVGAICSGRSRNQFPSKVTRK